MNSLFKVLFNFPSRYLFAIGLATVFSLRWSLPPASGCIPKQLDSEKTRSDRGERPYRPDTCYGTRPRSEGHRHSPTIALRLPYVTFRRAPRARRLDVGHFPIHSPLLGESRLVSFPPLNNMLKFSGCSRLNSGRTRCVPPPSGGGTSSQRTARSPAWARNARRDARESRSSSDQPARGVATAAACRRGRRPGAQLRGTAGGRHPMLRSGNDGRGDRFSAATLRQTRSRD